MTFISVNTLGTAPGRRDELVAHLTRRSDLLLELGCTAYDVGTNDEHPDSVFVAETWTDRDAHRASLQHPEVGASIAAARELLSGRVDGVSFDVVGSPLRDA